MIYYVNKSKFIRSIGYTKHIVTFMNVMTYNFQEGKKHLGIIKNYLGLGCVAYFVWGILCYIR